MADVVSGAKERLQRALGGRAEPEAACVTLVAGSTIGEVLDAFGADPGQPPVDPAEVPFGIPTVAVVAVPGGVVAIEDNGFAGSAPVVLLIRRSLQRPETEPIPPAGVALRVLHHAANPDPFTAAGQALGSAHQTLRGADAAEFLAAALREARR